MEALSKLLIETALSEEVASLLPGSDFVGQCCLCPGLKELRVFPGCRIQLSYLVTQSVLSTVTVPSLVTVDRTDCVTECTLLLPVLVLVLDVEDEYPEKYTPSSCTSRDIHHPHPRQPTHLP